MPLHKNQIISLTIDTISSDGNGIGRLDGQVVFVPGAAVGDVLRVKLVKLAKRHAYARIEQVVTPGPGRQKPDCPIAGSCGGCDFRQLSYETELMAKQGFVADALVRIGKLAATPLPILPSPQQQRYRNKVQYPVAAGKDGSLCFGFYASRSHRVIPCDDCLLQPERLNRIAAACAERLQAIGATPYNEVTRTGLIRHITLRQSTQSGDILLCIVATKPRFDGDEAFAAALGADFPELAGVVLNHNPQNTNVIYGRHSHVLYGSGALADALCDVPVSLNEHTFFQVNAPAAAQLFDAARQMADLRPEDVLLELYCGTGVIGLSMAHRCKSLIGVEIVPEAIESAKASAESMGLANTRFLCADAGEAAAQLAAEGQKPDVVLLDPPRKGASAATLQAILAMAPSRVVMISCNPATMARDLAVLAEGGYTLQTVQPADLFPRTKHVECACLLVRRD